MFLSCFTQLFRPYLLSCRRNYIPDLISGTLSRVPRAGTQKDAFLVLLARFVTLPRDARGRFRHTDGTLLGCSRSGRQCRYLSMFIYSLRNLAKVFFPCLPSFTIFSCHHLNIPSVHRTAAVGWYKWFGSVTVFRTIVILRQIGTWNSFAVKLWKDLVLNHATLHGMILFQSDLIVCIGTRDNNCQASHHPHGLGSAGSPPYIWEPWRDISEDNMPFLFGYAVSLRLDPS